MQSTVIFKNKVLTCATRITRVHGDEGHHTRLETDLNILKQEAVLSCTKGIQHCLVLSAANKMIDRP